MSARAKANERRKWRAAALKALGGAECVQCGHKDYRVLQIDHIVREKSPSNITWYKDIVRGLVDRENLQVLCANCHAVKTFIENNA